jgi:glycosyltransferase involved in cell wall biosynthesis
MSNNPLVNIYIPTYNNAKYIDKTIDSLIRQTYKNIKIIVLDNVSQDNTKDVVLSFTDPRVKYIRNDTNVGGLSNFNKCLDLAIAAKCDFFTIYHSDDIYKDTIIEKELALFTDDKIGASFALDILIDANDKTIGNGLQIPKELLPINSIDYKRFWQCQIKYPYSLLICPAFMSKPSVIKNIGQFPDGFGGAGDTAYYLMLAKKYNIAISPERLIYRRIWGGSDSLSTCLRYTQRADHFKVIDNLIKNQLSNEKIAPDLLQQYEFNKFWDDVVIARNLVMQNKSNEAKSLLRQNFKIKMFFQGLKNIFNFKYLLKYFALLLFTHISAAKIFVKLIRKLKK